MSEKLTLKEHNELFGVSKIGKLADVLCDACGLEMHYKTPHDLNRVVCVRCGYDGWKESK